LWTSTMSIFQLEDSTHPFFSHNFWGPKLQSQNFVTKHCGCWGEALSLDSIYLSCSHMKIWKLQHFFAYKFFFVFKIIITTLLIASALFRPYCKSILGPLFLVLRPSCIIIKGQLLSFLF
jgi:hypothetical protein